jgi:iron complex transport system substrate-binding protein
VKVPHDRVTVKSIWDLGSRISDLKTIRNPKSEFPNCQVGIPAEKPFCPGYVSRQNIRGSRPFQRPVFLPVFSGSKAGRFLFWILDFGLKKRSYKLVVLICLVGMTFAGCGGVEVPSPVADTREVRDDLGRTMHVPVKIERAISLAPSLTEMIFAIGAGDKLVGVTTYCNYPTEAATIEKVGDTQTPNIEKIIALRPQIIFISTASQLEAFSKILEEQGIAVYVTSSRTLEDVFENLNKLGDLFGKGDHASSLVVALAGRASRVRDQANYDRERTPIPMKNKPRVFVQISREPLFTIGRESFLTEIVESAGGISTTRDIATAYPKISKETALALDPDVILLSDSEDNLEPSEVFASSPAVKNGRVYKINADIISRPGPRLVDALEEIARDLRSQN